MESFFGRRIHFVGVGGISMSALARFAIQQGAVVSGSDGVDSALIDELRCIGAKIVIGVDISLVENCDTVVFSSAIKPTHPEIVEAHRLNLQVFERHEFLGKIASQFETVVAVAGTHGKTTVTAMIAHILKSLSVSFLANIGGIASGLSNYVQNGEDIQLFVAEACEYKKSLLSLKPSIGVVTNIECDHPDCYESLDAITAVFRKFLEKSKKTVVSINTYKNIYLGNNSATEHKDICETNADIGLGNFDICGNSADINIENCDICGNSADIDIENSDICGNGADIDIENIDICEKSIDTNICSYAQVSSFGVVGNGNVYTLTNVEKQAVNGGFAQKAKVAVNGKIVAELLISLKGFYNLQNALFAVAVAHMLGLDIKEICGALSSFGGVDRRFEVVGEFEGAKIVFDYAHHPTEIKCALEVAKEYGKVLAVFQPHTYSRTAKYFCEFVNAFSDIENIVIMPTYAAREQPSDGIDGRVLSNEINAKFAKREVYYCKDAVSTVDCVKSQARNFDIVIFLGAGDIYNLKSEFAKTNT